MDQVQLTFIVPVEHIAWARSLAREYWNIPPEVVITREGFGFGDYIEFPLGPSEGAEPTYYFCSDYYHTGTGYGQSEHFKAWLQSQGEFAWLTPLEGDPRAELAARGLVLTSRQPDYPAEILGIDK